VGFLFNKWNSKIAMCACMDNAPLLSIVGAGLRSITHVTMLNIEGVSVLCTSPSTPAMNVNAPCTTSPESVKECRRRRICRKECGPSIISHGGRCNSCFVCGVNVNSFPPFPSYAGDTTQSMFKSDWSACKRQRAVRKRVKRTSSSLWKSSACL
jgi:hypothetical protein